ncbi:MAG: hypothetical protein KIH01_03085 [Candidatus Freyarchaeota archaeon]|nr:hypothetical protein [Candidatus Jordarchaeia archaeon]
MRCERKGVPHLDAILVEGLKGMGFNDVVQDDKAPSAVVRKPDIIGEGSKTVTTD